MSELKPCPKCNGEASIEYENYDYDGGDWWLIREADVVCWECGLVFHAKNESREHQHGEHCLDFIIEAWNTRADDYRQLAYIDERIVRCKDCKKCIIGWCLHFQNIVKPDGFCAWGENERDIQ